MNRQKKQLIIKEALANGRLTSSNHAPDFQHQMTLLQAQAKAQNTTIDSLALAAVINQPFVNVTLSGAARVDHLESNLHAVQVFWSDSLAESLHDLEESAETYWRIRSQLAWN